MRPILFRGKALGDNAWAYGYYVFQPRRRGICGQTVTERDFDRHYMISPLSGSIEINPATIGQFTGLLDKNGKQIFEGDIVKTDFEGAIGVIAFGDYASPFNSDDFTHNIGFYPVWEKKFIKRLRKDLGYYCIATGDIEVIGNIHDNPELWKEGEA